MGQVELQESEFVSNNRSVALKLINGIFLSSAVDGFLGHPDMEDIGWLQSILSQHLSLHSSLWIVFENPTVKQTVLGLGSLGNQAGEEFVIDTLTLLFHLSP